jgi:hypothetical protein
MPQSVRPAAGHIELETMLPKALQPTMADIIMATAVASQRNPEAFRVAGDVIDMTGPRYQQRFKTEYGEGADPDYYKKKATQETLSRALGRENVLQMVPKDKD